MDFEHPDKVKALQRRLQELMDAHVYPAEAAYRRDTVGNEAARKEVAMIKVAAPNMALRVIDWAIQAHGAGGVSDDFGLARMSAGARGLHFADEPDEVHRNQIGRLELREHDRGDRAAPWAPYRSSIEVSGATSASAARPR